MPAIGLYEVIVIGVVVCGGVALAGLAVAYLLRRAKK